MRGVEQVGAVPGVTQVFGIARLAPRLQQPAVRAELVHAAVAVSVGDENVATGGNGDVGRLIERWARVTDAVGDGQTASGGPWRGGHTTFFVVARIRRRAALAQGQHQLAITV